MLLDVLPPMVLVRADDPRGPLLTHLSTLMISEIESTGVGRSLVLEHLAQITLERPNGRLAAFADDGIGAALRAMHSDVGRRWTLSELAAISQMSRSAFAASFKAKVGTAPLTYLIEWLPGALHHLAGRQPALRLAGPSRAANAVTIALLLPCCA